MNNEETDNCSQPSACEKSTPIASSSVRARKTIKKTTTMQRKKNKCSVCKKVMLGGSLKRHMIRKHSTKLNDNQVKRIVWDAGPCKDYHKNVSCSVCGKAFRSDYLKKHIKAKHGDVLNTVDAIKKQSTLNEKMSYNSYDRKVTSSTTCAMKSTTNHLHWAFKHIHDETVTFLENKGDRDASERTTNLLAPVEEKLTNILEQEFNCVANRLILESSDSVATSI